MEISKNPFHTLYLTEGVEEVDLPPIFSPILIPHVGPLFQPGNVLLKGMQGTGKSMLLSLLESNVRLAFHNNENHPYPLHGKQCRFVGAGINLSKSLAIKLNELMFDKDRDEDIRKSKAVFGDYFNTWVIRDLLLSLTALIESKEVKLLTDIGISSDMRALDSCIEALSADAACPYFQSRSTTLQGIEALTERLQTYLALVSFNIDVLPEHVQKTRSVIGEPISTVVRTLRSHGVIDGSANVFIVVDQFETLLRKKQDDGDDQKHRRFVDAIDELLSTRDRTVSYRLGARPNANLEKSEPLRDYLEINLDEILRRREHAKLPVFPRFADDVFRRRIGLSELRELKEKPNLLRLAYGKSPSFEERATLSAGKHPTKIIRTDKDWPNEIKELLRDLSTKSILSAKLGEAWVRQYWSTPRKAKQLDKRIVNAKPWLSPDKRWWKKERMAIGVLQIAAANKQRVPFFGESDIVSLAGENILVFVSMCREIWESWARSKSDSETTPFDDSRSIDRIRQDDGIRDASRVWREKMASSPQGNTLQRLVDTIGHRLHRQLIEDKNMSYPGANGFSLAIRDLETDPDIQRLLYDATAEGFLLQRHHTPKSLSRGKSIKWYPHPIFSPYYELTVPHTKEPLYLSIKKLRHWLEEEHILVKKVKPKEKNVSKKPRKTTCLWE